MPKTPKTPAAPKQEPASLRYHDALASLCRQVARLDPAGLTLPHKNAIAAANRILKYMGE